MNLQASKKFTDLMADDDNTQQDPDSFGSAKSGPKQELTYVRERLFNDKNTVETPMFTLIIKVNELVDICAAFRDISSHDLLQKVSKRLAPLLDDTFDGFKIYRTGFMLIGPESGLNHPLDQWLKKIINLVEAPLLVNGHTINLTCDIGISRVDDQIETLEDLIDRAEYALDNSSQEAGSSYKFFNTNNVQQARDEITLTQDLYQALDENELTLHYQPVFSTGPDGTEFVEAEALIRWNHPQKGLISPGGFIPLAEKTGQIMFIDRWVLEQSVRQISAWMKNLGKQIPLGVNISAWQFRDDFLVDKVKNILDEVELPPHLLKIEITETSVMNDMEHAASMIDELKDLGIRIALDDFGTGQASFEYLSEFSFDELKIDRSFLDFTDAYAHNQTLVELMIETGQRVDLDIVAEGIETEEQFDFVRNRGCEKVQGFMFDKPMSADKLASKVKCDHSTPVPSFD